MDKLSLKEVALVTGAEANSDAEIFFEGVSTDSRKIQSGELFVALKGENCNGESFAKDALKKGAAAILVSKTAKRVPEGVVLKVEDTLTAYRQIAGAWRDRFQIPIVAVTGSNGKTTTKDLTAAALNGLGHVQKTSGNFNNEVGVPMTLLELKDKHKAAVVEIGMRGLGQIETLAQVVKPMIGIVTNVSEAHIELLGSIENIAKAKGELVEAIQAGGTIILNADNRHTADMKNLAGEGVKVLTYSLENETADFVAKNILIGSVSTEFILSFRGREYDFEISMLGRHNVSNALAAIAAGYACGLKVPEVQRGFSTLTTTKMRYEVIRRDGLTIINDAYNASPASMRAAIHTTSEVYDGRLIAVLGDMLELGEISETVHREIGAELVEHKFDTLITLGELGKFIAEGAREAGLENVYTFDTHEDAAKKILEIVRDGDTILFKASHVMHMEKIIELI
ncbi:MAG: UDP-N-acetylmuramoyl-tripeptide--D-alanyl-D-alanine ligase [Selenomonadaceae bacterium]|nr:UDP-N-acetylmuramoyl-tripeptide--D-alanyl-D-alanine ligase [Selenomonadaceae bacterium]